MPSRSLPLNGPVPESLMSTPSFLIAWLFDRFFDDYVTAIAELELRPADHAILLTVADRQPIRQARLGEHIRIDHATFVGTVNALERRDLLRRKPDPVDRRALVVELSRSGRRMVIQAQNVVERLEVASYRALEPNELERLTSLLGKIAQSSGTSR